jgi:hypothetical protein
MLWEYATLGAAPGHEGRQQRMECSVGRIETCSRVSGLPGIGPDHSLSAPKDDLLIRIPIHAVLRQSGPHGEVDRIIVRLRGDRSEFIVPSMD